MLRNIVVIDEEKCNGCGLCVTACAEGAIQIVGGKARLISENYCDGLGACLGHCPQGAITVEQREAAAFDEEAVKRHLEQQAVEQVGQADSREPAEAEASTSNDTAAAGFVCPGMAARRLAPKVAVTPAHAGDSNEPAVASELRQWPVQLGLLSPRAEFLEGAELLLVADCVPLAVGDFHRRWLRGKAVAVACPKLDNSEQHVQRLAAILEGAQPSRLAVLHMEVPCCSGLTRIAQAAMAQAGIQVPFEDITIGLDGERRS